MSLSLPSSLHVRVCIILCHYCRSSHSPLIRSPSLASLRRVRAESARREEKSTTTMLVCDADASGIISQSLQPCSSSSRQHAHTSGEWVHSLCSTGREKNLRGRGVHFRLLLSLPLWSPWQGMPWQTLHLSCLSLSLTLLQKQKQRSKSTHFSP